MGKRLVLALALVMLVAGPALAAVQNVKVSGDLEVMPVGRFGFDFQGRDTATDEGAILSFLRLRVDADLTDNVSVVARFLSERDWDQEDAANTDIDLDLGYVTLKEFLYAPLSLTVGRQELHMGSEMIVGDPDTNNNTTVASVLDTTQPDLSKRKSFDAFRATLDLSPVVIDAIYAKMVEGTHVSDDDETLMGVNAAFQVGDNWDSVLEAYIYDRLREKDFVATHTKDEHTYVAGARAVASPVENLTASIEGAYQFGDYADTLGEVVDRDAFAIEAGVTLAMPDVALSPSITALYAFFSGEDSTFNAALNNDYQAWDPMYENQTYGDIANTLLNQTNAQLGGLILAMAPMDDVIAKIGYYAFWWANADQGTSSALVHGNTVALENSTSFLGQEIDLNLTYNYTEDVQLGLNAGVFIPGTAFTSANDTPASQLLGSMLVKF